jgi:hypothetical protein
MEDTIAALEQSYLQLAAQAVCRPRIDIRIPTSDALVLQECTLQGAHEMNLWNRFRA